jgi:ABC-type phosphate transport system substrate-binding protein
MKRSSSLASAFAFALLGRLSFMPALADVVVIVNVRNSSNLTAADIAQIYLGRSTNLKPIDTAEPSVTRNEFYAKVTGKTDAQVRSIWSKLDFTGRARPPREFASSEQVVKAVGADPKAIGYVDRASVDASVKIVLELK